MGMAASQARYLELTARKTNVEFQGQQINQQRTELANESAGLFSQMMGLQVPTAPSSGDYTTTQYTFNDGNNDCTIANISNLTGDPDYNANVTYTYNQNVYTGIGKTRTDLGVKDEGVVGAPVYWLTNGAATSPINQTKLTKCSATDSNATAQLQELTQICKSNPTAQIATDVGYNATTQTITDISKAYYYSTNGVNYYYSSTNLATASASGGAAVSLTGYYAANISKTQTQTEKAYVTTADSGRYSTIKLASDSTDFTLAASTTTDQNAYNDAVNEYTYKQQAYQKQLTDMNAKTSIIQSEDRALELQLKQLDTEQQALSTEMDSVKKVIDKNIEQTYKTFSS